MTRVKTVKRVTGYKYKCVRCGKGWDGRKLENKELKPDEEGKVPAPDQCPNCKRKDWQKGGQK